MTPALAALYQGVILEHNARPRGFGPLALHTHEARGHNPLCGDMVTLRLQLDGGTVVAAGFEGDGCALCRASASLLTVAVTGRPATEALALADALDALVSPGPDRTEDATTRLGDLAALGGVRDVPARRRCATLPWEALREALRPLFTAAPAP
jgi:nitrogen fixation protein NifU and related proteins